MMPTDAARSLFEARPIAIGEIVPSPYNTRVIFNQARLEEMAQSMKLNGIVEPLIVRRNPKAAGNGATGPVAVDGIAPFELIAGERRLRAAKLAGLAEVPAIVRELSELEVLDLQLIENVQREDLHPLEEARGFEQRKNAGATIQDIVKITGKDRTHVSRRLQLLNLNEEAQQIFLAGGMIPKQAQQIARLPQSEQPKALCYLMTENWDLAAKVQEGERLKLKEGSRALVPPSELGRFIASVIMRPLAAAPWSKKDAQLVPEAGACNTCTKRTGHNPLLFDESASKDDRCLDGACYEAKFAAHLVQIQTKAAAKGETLPIIDGNGSYSEWREVHGDACGKEVKALVASGHDRGKIKRVCMDKSCTVHWAARGRYSRAQQGQDEKLKIERQYRATLWKAVSKAVKQPALEDFRSIAQYMWSRAWHDIRKAYMDALGIEAPKRSGSGPGGHDYEKPVARLIAAMKTTRELQVWMYSFTLFRDAYITDTYRLSTKDDLHQAAERYSVDAKEIRREIDAEFAQRRAKRAEAAKARAEKAKKKAARKKLAAAQGELL